MQSVYRLAKSADKIDGAITVFIFLINIFIKPVTAKLNFRFIVLFNSLEYLPTDKIKTLSNKLLVENESKFTQSTKK